jgi:uncharacterized protein (TIGR04255 family)
MTFPESERVVYAADTLVEVACQLNFPPVLAIGIETPVALQERLRAEYPLYEPIPPFGGAPPQLAALIQQLPNAPNQALQHRFTTADGTSSVTVGPQLLAITTSAYKEWPVFLASVEAARAAVEEIYRPSFYTRVGLRYQDVIDPNELKLDASWAELLSPTLVGFFGASEPEIRNAVRESGSNVRIALDGATDSFVHINHGLAQKGDGDDERVYLIDADYFTNRQRDSGEINGLLGYFRQEAGRLFRWAITDTLRDALGRRDVVVAPNE